MSTNQPYGNPNWAQPQAPPAARGSKMLSCLLIGCGGMALLCCGGGIAGFYYLRAWAGQTFSEDPAVIASVTREIADVEFGEPFRPAVSMNVNIPFVGHVASMVVYVDRDHDSQVMLMAIGKSVAQGQQADLKKNMEQSMRDQGFGQQNELNVSQSFDKQFTIRGEQTTFHFVHGKDRNSGAERVVVTGTFQGKTGPTTFMFSGDPTAYDDKAIQRIIESIK